RALHDEVHGVAGAALAHEHMAVGILLDLQPLGQRVDMALAETFEGRQPLEKAFQFLAHAALLMPSAWPEPSAVPRPWSRAGGATACPRVVPAARRRCLRRAAPCFRNPARACAGRGRACR